MKKFIHSKINLILKIMVVIIILACSKDDNVKETPMELAKKEYDQLKASGNFIEFSTPEQNPGPPFYARIAEISTKERLFMESGNTVIIPMMRNVECINPEFNLLQLFDVPAAFGCELTVYGKGLIEPDAPPTAFPIIAYLQSENMPMWFVEKGPLLNAMQDGILTLGELQSLNPKKGVASWYIEYNKPRSVENHLLVIESRGSIPATGETFEYTVNSISKSQQIVELTIK